MHSYVTHCLNIKWGENLVPELDQTFAIAAAITAAAGLMRGFAGVGSGMLMAPIFVMLYGPIETVAMVILMEIVVTGQLMQGVYKQIDWRVIAPMGAMAALCMPVGSWLIVTLDPALVGKAMSFVVLGFSVFLLIGWRYHGPKRLITTLGVGSLSGVLMALTSLGNPPVMIYLLSSQDDAARNRANFTGYFAITLGALITWMFFSGLLSLTAATRAAYLLPVFMLAVWIGSRLFRKANEQLYRRCALGLLVCIGLYGVLR